MLDVYCYIGSPENDTYNIQARTFLMKERVCLSGLEKVGKMSQSNISLPQGPTGQLSSSHSYLYTK